MIPFDDIVAYVAGYDARFAEAIEPADVDEIEELAALTGDELPPVYRDFLEVMGRSTGWIDVGRLDFNIQTVLDYYRRDTALPIDEFLRIGSDTKDPAYNPHLQLSLVAADLKVVAFPGCTLETLADVTASQLMQLAGSMQQMFARPAFRMFEVYRPGRRPTALKTGVGTPRLLDQLEPILCGEWGLEPVFWSNSQVRAYRGDDMAVDAAQFGPRSLDLLVSADDAQRQARLATDLAARFEARNYAAPAA